MKRISTSLALVVLICLLCHHAEAQNSIPSDILGNGGGVMESSEYRINGTAGQPLVGISGNATNIIASGFWYQLGSGSSLTNIDLTSPDGGQNWCGGSVQEITWTATGEDIDHIHLTYSTDSGANYEDIVVSTPNDGSYEWTVPEISSSTVRVRAIAEDSGSNAMAADASNSDLTIELPQISASPGSFTFNATPGGSDPGDRTLSISNSGCGTLSWSVSGNAGWLSLSPASGSCTTETDSVTVSVSIAGLAEGTYGGEITVTSAKAENSPQTLPVTLNLSDQQLHEMDMDAGWHLISIPVQPSETNVVTVLSSLGESYDSIWRFIPGVGWRWYLRETPEASNLNDVESGIGYWIMINIACSLSVIGQQPSTDISLVTDWNLVGYNSQETRNIEDCIVGITGTCNSIWEYISGTGWRWYLIDTPDASNLWTMTPGKGYWVEANDACPWDIYATSPPAAPPAMAGFTRGSSPPARPDVPYILWGNIEVDGVRATSDRDLSILLKVGDEVQSTCRIDASDRYIMDVPSDSLSPAEIYVQIGDRLLRSSRPVPTGKPGELLWFDLSVKLPPELSRLHQNFPNPFNPETWIPYQLSDDAHVEIFIYNSTGHLVRVLDLGRKLAGFYNEKSTSAYWDGRNEAGESVASGIYFYQIQAGDYTATRKLIIAK